MTDSMGTVFQHQVKRSNVMQNTPGIDWSKNDRRKTVQDMGSKVINANSNNPLMQNAYNKNPNKYPSLREISEFQNQCK